MPNVLWADVKGLKPPKLDKMVEMREAAFIKKLRVDDTSDGLRIKPLHGAADSRARTGRVTEGWRAVLFRLDGSDGVRTYVYAGTWPHDEGIRIAKSRLLQGNPINGIGEFVDTSVAKSTSAPGYAAGTNPATMSFLTTSFNYSRSDLIEVIGFDASAADALLGAMDEDELLAIAAAFPNAWQQHAALSLGVGQELGKIQLELGFAAAPEPDQSATEDDRILRALGHPAAKMQFAYVESDEALERIIEGGDFGAWRVFLHPEQQRYATRDFAGPFRLTGGAGTGKTVVLLHRARMLASRDGEASIVLTTYTRALAENLDRDLERLDPTIRKSPEIGAPGVYVRGIDQIANAVRVKAGAASFGQAAATVLGSALGRVSNLVGNHEGWRQAIDEVSPDLPEDLLLESFFVGEYLQIVLPMRVASVAQYSAIRRAGRGIALDRKKRAEVWKVIEKYRANARAAERISFAEVAAIAAAWLEQHGAESRLVADHVLVDEGQDLTPSHWQLLRALARSGENDLFIAEDTHQRIYGQHVVLRNYGIRIIGRSRRLTLNYRTTEETLRYSMALLSGGEFLDSEEQTEGVSGYRSIRRGPQPISIAGKDQADQIDRVSALVSGWLDDGVDASSIALLARTNQRARSLRDGLHARGLSSDYITAAKVEGNRPVVMTMHTAKGMEFLRVVLFDISDGVMPQANLLTNVSVEEQADILLRERSLLYVAASRARDVLAVTWAGTPSPLLG
ncbi:UvrD-helicase domain-containing protein [Microbacterium sp. NPDC056003]|uniref:UvrD-helicase domain-containing protein n=1 Tax=Microbacterium sp. NPDC056003 TaxID=3345676 RepID=UPI0035D78F91